MTDANHAYPLCQFLMCPREATVRLYFGATSSLPTSYCELHAEIMRERANRPGAKLRGVMRETAVNEV